MRKLQWRHLAFVPWWLGASIVYAGPSDQLQELRGRIEQLQRQLAEAEGSRSEATDALRASERAISEANRRVFQLGQRSKDAKASAARLEAQRVRASESA